MLKLVTMDFTNIENYRIFECVTGSRLYGLHHDKSDYDYRGIVIPPKEIMLDPFQNFDQKDKFEGEDRTLYSLDKFFRLCADSNPNIIELLFVPAQSTLLQTQEWVLVRQNLNLFLSKKAKYTFTGYAFSQLKKIESHRQWFVNPPEKKPTRKDYGLSGHVVLTTAWVEALRNGLKLDLLKEEFHEEFENEKKYRDAMVAWKNYISWRDNRNPFRKELEEKFGYDTKFASHIFRLMEEGKELLLTGNIIFPLKDADYIRGIKLGALSYDSMLTLAREMEAKFEDWYEQSSLPHKPNRKKLSELYLKVVESYWKRINK